MSAASSSAGTVVYHEPHSPELVLVDPELAERARASLPLPNDTLACTPRQAPVATLVADVGEHVAPSRGRVRLRQELARESPMLRVALAVLALLAGLLGVVTANQDGASTVVATAPAPVPVTASVSLPPRPATQRSVADAGAPPSAQSSGQRSSVQSSRPAPRSASARRSQATPRRFAWAPLSTASGYRFELFRGTTLLLRRETAEAQLAVPLQWRFGGRLVELRPGTYRWYVWPIVNGRKSASALVQAQLIVPA